MVKQHDWVATLFFQPDKSLEDIVNLGVTPETASIKDRSYYREIPQIQEAFKNEQGDFDENKFNNFYQSALMLYNQVETDKLETNILETFEYDPGDIFAPIGSKERDNTARMISFANPLRQSRGISSLTQLGDPTKSLREIGQENKVFNWDTQQFEDWTPNDLNLFSGLTAPSLVLAAWDEDGEHEVNGRIVKHKRGDLKFTEDGDTYYETLSGRSVEGKEQLHTSDILTVDGSVWNKYDFFDSDGLDKSVGGVIAKTVATVAPMLIPGVGSVYGGVTAAKELFKLMPVLWKSIAGIAAGDTSDMKSVKAANRVQAYFSRFDSSTSDYGKNHMISLESLGSIIASSSTQLMQQRLIGKIPLMFHDKENIPLSAIKWGRALSLSYMAGTSSTDTYSIFKDAGASDRMAGLGTLASIGAMGLLMNNDYFRDFWYEGTALSRKPIKDAIKAALPEVQDVFKTGTKELTKQETANWFLKTQDAIYKKLAQISKNSLIAGFQNEAIEETVEELAVDAIKGIASGLNYLGLVDSDTRYDFGFSTEDMLARYGMAFVGGGIGGVVFELHNKFDNFRNKNTNEALEKKGFDEMIYLIRNRKANQLRKELERWHQKGKLGNTNLSGSKYELVKDGDKTTIAYKEASDKDSQNDVIYNQILDVINKVETVLDEERLNISDLQLQTLRVVDPDKTKDLSDEELRTVYSANVLDQLEKKLYETKITSRIFSDWNDLTQDILSTKSQMENLLTLDETSVKTDSDVAEHIKTIKASNNYKTLETKLENLRNKRDEILSGKKNDYYTGQILFAFNPELNKAFGTSLGKHAFTLLNYNKKYEDLTNEEREIVDQEFITYTTTSEKDLVYRNYDVYWRLNNNLHKDIKESASKAFTKDKLFQSYELSEVNLELNELMQELDKVKQELVEENAKEKSDETKIDSLIKKEIDLENKIQDIRSTKPVLLMRTPSEEYNKLLHLDKDVTLGQRFQSFAKYVEYLKTNGIGKDPNDPILQTTLIGYAEELEELLTDEFVEKIDSELYEGFSTIVLPFIKELIDALKSNDIDKVIEFLEITDGNYDFLEESDINAFSLLSGVFYNDDQTSGVDVKKMLNAYRDLENGPAYKIVDKFVRLFMPEVGDTVQMFIRELTKFGSVRELESYVLQNESALNDLKKLKSSLPILIEIIDSNNENNLLKYVNILRESAGNSLFETVSEVEQNSIMNELVLFESRLNSLIQTIEYNNSQKMVEQKKISLHMKQKFTNLLLNNEHSVIKSQITRAFDVDLDKLIQESNFPVGEINDSNFKQYQTAVDTLETKLYSEVADKGFSKEEIIDKIIKMFNISNLIRPTSTKFTKDVEVITDYDQAVYLLSILTYPSHNFNVRYREVLQKPEFDRAPLFGQEYCVKLAYTFAHDVEMLNLFVNRLQKEVMANEKLENEENTEYLHNRTPLLNTIAVVLGAAGSGKTAGVSNIFATMLDDSWKIIASAPEKRQAKKLADSIGKGEIGVLTQKELISSILGRDMTEDDYEHSHYMFKLKSSVKLSTDDLFDGNENNILFLDEISLYSAPEIELITKWAVKNNVLLFFAGDISQNKRFINHNDMSYESGLEDFIYLKTPKLTVSLRPNNIAKADNLYQTQKVVDYIQEQRDRNPELTLDDFESLINAYFKENEKINLSYFSKDGDFEGGEKIIKEDVVNTELDKLLNSGKKVAIITDRPDKYTDYKTKVENIIDAKSVQGAEYDYVLIDKDFRISSADGKTQNVYQRLVDLYTLTQRSTNGTLIVDRNTPMVYINNIEDNSKAGTINSKNWQKSVNDFKRFIVESLGSISGDILDVINRVAGTTILEEKPTETVVEEEPVPENPFKEESVQEEKEPESIIVKPVKSEVAPKKPTPIPALASEKPKVEIQPHDDRIIRYRSTTAFWNNRDFIENFNQQDGIKGRSVFDVLGIDFVDGSKKHMLQYKLAAYFMFGYNKTQNSTKKAKAIRNIVESLPKRTRGQQELVKSFINALESNNVTYKLIPYVFNDYHASMYCAEVNGILIPIVIAKQIVRNEQSTTLEIQLTREPSKSSSKGKVFKPITMLSPIVKTFDPVVLIANDWEGVKNHPNNRRFCEINEGKTIGVVSVDPFATEDDLKQFLTLPDDYSWTTTPNNSFRLLGVKRRAVTLSELWKLCNNNPIRKGAKSILTINTFTTILQNIVKAEPSLKAYLIDRLSNVIVGYSAKRPVKIKLEGSSDHITTLTFTSNTSVKSLAEWLNKNWTDDVTGIVLLQANKDGVEYPNWGDHVFADMFADRSNTILGAEKTEPLSILKTIDDKHLLDTLMPGGYYLNDNVPWSAAITKNSVYHIIDNATLSAKDLGFYSDADVMLPHMLFSNSDDNSEKETIVEKPSETKPVEKSSITVEETDIEKNVIQHFEQKGEKVQRIFSPVTTETWNYQHILVTLENGKEHLITYTRNHKIIDDVDGTKLAAFMSLNAQIKRTSGIKPVFNAYTRLLEILCGAHYSETVMQEVYETLMDNDENFDEDFIENVTNVLDLSKDCK